MTRLLRLVALLASVAVVLSLTAGAFGSLGGQPATVGPDPSLAASGLGSPFASGSGICDPAVGYATFTAPISGDHPDPVAELTASGPAILGNPFATYEYTGGPGSVWESYPGKLYSGNTVNIEIDCFTASSDVNYTLALYDAPSTPFTVSGAVTDAPCNPSCYATNDIGFSTPATAHYVADLTVTQGSLDWSPGQHDLGYLNPGQHDIGLTPLPGPTAEWSLSIHALPVILSGLQFGFPDISPGQSNPISYHVDGDVTLSATIKNSSGVVVRTLASNLAVAVGDHTLTWNELNAGGSPVPDGTYTVTVNFTDYAGNSGSGQASVVVDGTPPVIKPASGSTIPTSGKLVIDVQDALTGLAVADLHVDGVVAKIMTSGRQLVYAPKGGWSPGEHTWQLIASDKAGNTSSASGSFMTPPGCRVPRVIGRSLVKAKHAIIHSGCTVGTISRKASSKRLRGHVVSQKPPPGSLLQKRARVSLWIGSGHGRRRSRPRSAPRGAWSNPYPLGATVSNAGWQVRVLTPVGINANGVMEAAGNPPPPAGSQYALIHLVITNVASGKQYLDQYIDGNPGVWVKGVHAAPNPAGYPPSGEHAGPNYLILTDISSVDSGETVTGYLSYLIKSDDARTLKLLLPGHRKVWLALH